MEITTTNPVPFIGTQSLEPDIRSDSELASAVRKLPSTSPHFLTSGTDQINQPLQEIVHTVRALPPDGTDQLSTQMPMQVQDQQRITDMLEAGIAVEMRMMHGKKGTGNGVSEDESDDVLKDFDIDSTGSDDNIQRAPALPKKQAEISEKRSEC